MIAPLAVSKPGKLGLSQNPQVRMETQKSKKAMVHIIFEKNQTSFWTVVNLNLDVPDMATMRPITDLSPMAKTTPVQVPCTTNVEESARLRVSSAFNAVASTSPETTSLWFKYFSVGKG